MEMTIIVYECLKCICANDDVDFNSPGDITFITSQFSIKFTISAYFDIRQNKNDFRLFKARI